MDSHRIVQVNFNRAIANRENVGEIFKTKDLANIPSRDNKPKKAFGDLQNTIHKQKSKTPAQKPNFNKNVLKSAPYKLEAYKKETKKLAPAERPENSIRYKEANHESSLEYTWAMKAALNDDEISQILNFKSPDRRQKPPPLPDFEVNLDVRTVRPPDLTTWNLDTDVDDVLPSFDDFILDLDL